MRGMGYFAAATDGDRHRAGRGLHAAADPGRPQGHRDRRRDRLRLRPAARRRPRRLRRARVAAGLRRLPRRRDGRAAAATRSRTCPWAATRSSRSSRRPATTRRARARRLGRRGARRRRTTSRMTRDWAALSGGAVHRRRQRQHGRAVRLRRRQGVRPVAGDRVVLVQPDSQDPANPQAGPPTVVLELPQEVDVTSFLIDPTAGLRRRRLGEHPRVHDRDLGERDGASRPPSTARAPARSPTADLGRLNQRVPAGTTGRGRRASSGSACSARSVRHRVPAELLGHGLHRPDGAQGPRRRSQRRCRPARSA